MTIDPKPATTPVVGVVDPEPAWQPRGGKVAFTVRSSGAALTGVQVAVCFGWNGKSFTVSPHVWVTELANNETTYNAIVPLDLASAPMDAQRTGLWIVPISDMRVMISGGPTTATVDVTRPVGITQPGIGILFAFVAVMAALGMFYLFACARKVPGRGLVLWLISTRNGVASLSQLQIMLWTFVVGASAVYVMALSGSLIEITDGTLALLGIAGVATVTSKLQNSQADAKSAPSTLPAAPGAIPFLNIIGAPADTEIRLAWAAPTTGGSFKKYQIQYRVDQANPPGWSTVAEEIILPHCTVLGLVPRTGYNFQVQAVNAAGPGPAAAAGPFRTADPFVPDAGAPGAVAGLREDMPPAVSLLSIAWSPATGVPTGYVVQYRRHDSVEPWIGLPPSHGITKEISPLQPGTPYDFRVQAINDIGGGAWSYVLTSTTVRNPNWADLVVAGPGRGEIDVTRVQMLFFTLVTAVFVAMTVLNSFTIPDIPQGFLILMGLSNGVYLGNKFISDGT